MSGLARRAALLLMLVALPACAAQQVNITVLGDGWDAAHEGDFNTAWQQMRDDLMNDEPYMYMKGFYNFTGIFKASDQQGCSRQYDTKRFPHDKEAQNPYYSRKTHYGLTYTLRDPKCVPPDPQDLPADGSDPPGSCPDIWIGGPASARDTIKADLGGNLPTVVLVITPDQDLAGGVTFQENADPSDPKSLFNRVADRAMIVMTTRDLKHNFKDFAAVLAHELGHAVYHLGDEYSDNKGTCDLGVAASYPNLFVPPSGAADAKPPWQHLIDSKILELDPSEGGAMYCKRGVFHGTDACRMLNQYSYSGFCPVCLEAMMHGVMEKKQIIIPDKTDPNGDKTVLKYHWTPMTFTVHTKEEKAGNGCDPRYLNYWELDGQRLDFWVREPEGDGAYYQATIGNTSVPIFPGNHSIKFCIGDALVACKTPPTSKDAPGVTPWDSYTWYFDADPPPADMNIPWLKKKKSLD